MKQLHKIILSIILLAIVAGSCRKYLDVNSDPVNPQDPQAQLLIAPIVYQMANNTALDYRQIFKTIQYWSSTSSGDTWETHGYSLASDLGGYIWRMTYVNLGQNLEDMINDGVTNQKYAFAGIGYAIKAWAYQLTTDLHGPIILDEAFNPDLLSFPYQDQDEVYERVRDWCQLSLQYLDMEGPVDYSTYLASTAGDNIYGGDREKWKKFVYGLLALQYSHLVNKSAFASSYADSVVKYVDLSFSNDEEDPTVFFTASNGDDSNPFGPQYGIITSTSYGRVASPILGLLTGGVRGEVVGDTSGSIDPRLSRMLAPDMSDTIYRANTPTEGGAAPHVLGDASTFPGKYIFSDDARYPLMSYAQLQFAKSEALFLKGNTGDAYTSYLAGIQAHMNFVNLYGLEGFDTVGNPDKAITQAEVDAYLASSEVAQNAAELTMADIMGQKFIAQWGWAGMEQWCDLRKYHYDSTVFRTWVQLDPDQLAIQNDGKYAYRYRPRYNSEYIWNSTELDKWGGNNDDYMTYETWFSMP